MSMLAWTPGGRSRGVCCGVLIDDRPVDRTLLDPAGQPVKRSLCCQAICAGRSDLPRCPVVRFAESPSSAPVCGTRSPRARDARLQSVTRADRGGSDVVEQHRDDSAGSSFRIHARPPGDSLRAPRLWDRTAFKLASLGDRQVRGRGADGRRNLVHGYVRGPIPHRYHRGPIPQ